MVSKFTSSLRVNNFPTGWKVKLNSSDWNVKKPSGLKVIHLPVGLELKLIFLDVIWNSCFLFILYICVECMWYKIAKFSNGMILAASLFPLQNLFSYRYWKPLTGFSSHKSPLVNSFLPSSCISLFIHFPILL